MDLLADQLRAYLSYKFNIMKLISVPRDTAVHTHDTTHQTVCCNMEKTTNHMSETQMFSVWMIYVEVMLLW